LRRYFSRRGWTPFAYQEGVWAAYAAGESGLIHVPTGTGKTLAAVGGELVAGLREAAAGAATAEEGVCSTAAGAVDHGVRSRRGSPLRLVWITPLRALARDTVQALQEVVDEVGLPWRVELRTGDTSSSRKRRQRREPPEILVTTPESLTLLFTYPEHTSLLGGVRAAVVDEWHELLSSKRGTQTELALARLRRLNPGLRTWGLSATLANLEEALETLLGCGADGGSPCAPGSRDHRRPRGRLHDGAGEGLEGPVSVETILPEEATRFPWSGHLGLSLLERVAAELDAPGTALLFTNTRSQAELWHRALVESRPEWSDDLLLHHGSLDRESRDEVETRLRSGQVRCVVCTSTLDLGVDFSPVDRVLQVGSPKGIGRLLQRAGRSGHRPGGERRVLCVPTHALELVEFAAAREAVAQGQVEARAPLERPLDVLAQHLVTLGLGGGFMPEDILAEVRTTRAYRELSDEAFGWVLDFVTRGGEALEAYPRYHRVVEEEGGLHRVRDRRIARQHRMSVGTITDDGQLLVRFLKGRKLGRIEESFLGRLAPGDRFLFAGRELELVRIRDMQAYVRLAKGRRGRRPVPRWMGGRMPLSTRLAGRVAAVLSGRAGGDAPERATLAPLLEVQERWSSLPGPGRLLLERHRTREGHHLFAFPFLGRLAHDGLAALLAWRLSREEPRSVKVSANDYGFEILSPEPLSDDPELWAALFAPDGLTDHLLACLNATELARRRFREVARVAGLVFPGYPGRSKSARQLQASSGLIFDVLERWDPENLLLQQARREVLEEELEVVRLRRGLEAMSTLEHVWTTPPRLTPLAFPIWAERIQASVSSESWLDRVRRMARRLEEAAGEGVRVG
jgi:ATP-dependent Lhr-like helicase